MATDNIIIVKTKDIYPNLKNPRVIRNEQYNKLMQSILDFPDMLNKRPLVCFTSISNQITVLGGNMRLKAIQDIGIAEIPVIMADKWTEKQRDMFIIKDNVSFGDWDWDIIANEWKQEEVTDWGLEIRSLEPFQPFLEPTTSMGNITEEEIEKRAREIAKSMIQGGGDYEALCPKCGHEFKFTADGR